MQIAQTIEISMIQCQNCGETNAAESQFCRFCGHRSLLRQPANYEASPPRPYGWKTDEYQTQAEARPLSAAQPTTALNPHQPYQQTPQAMQFNPQMRQDLTGNYRCPSCGTHYLPVIERRISTAGWITFGLLLVFTFVFFWIGLLLKEDVAICPVCKRQVA